MLLSSKQHALKWYGMIRILFLIIILQPGVKGLAQRKVIKAGEPLPYTGPFVINGDTKNPKTLEAFKGEYLILDLFSSSCIVCFQVMPKVNQLQKDYKGKVRFLLIGREDGRIGQTYKKFEKKQDLKLDVIFDSVFFRRANIKFVPTYIWIRPDGTVAAITDPGALYKKNIDSFLEGGPIDLGDVVEKNPFDFSVPLLVNGNGGSDSSTIRRTVLGRWNTKMPYYFPEMKYIGPNKAFNISGLVKAQLYKLAYWGTIMWDFSDSMYSSVYRKPFFVDATGKELVTEIKRPQYFYSDSYSGEKVPDIKKRLQGELKDYFDEEVEFVKKPMPCWVLKASPKAKEILQSKNAKSSNSFSFAGLEFKHAKISQLIDILAFTLVSDTVFIDETGIDFPVDLKIDALLTDRNDFFKAINKLGLYIELQYREMEVMLIRTSENIARRDTE